jgi:hypothetical protein
VLREYDYRAYAALTSRNRTRVRAPCAHARDKGVLSVTVHLEAGRLSERSHLVRAIHGDEVRAIYDPDQISEAAALALLCVKVPDLVRRGFRVLHVAYL